MVRNVANSLIRLDMYMHGDMPISKNDFAKGRAEDALIVKIQSFLDANKDKAFTEEEIMRHFYPDHIAWPGDTFAFSSAILILAFAGKVELRYINISSGVKTYFSSKS